MVTSSCDEAISKKVFQLLVSAAVIVGQLAGTGEIEFSSLNFDDLVGRCDDWFGLNDWGWRLGRSRDRFGRLLVLLVVSIRIANVD